MLSPLASFACNAGPSVSDPVQIVRTGNIDGLRAFLSSGGNLEWRDADGDSLLARAVYMQNQDAAKLLLEHGYSPDSHSLRGHTPLSIACKLNNKELVELLLRRSKEINAATFEGYTPLHFAVQHTNEPIARLLLASGAKVNARTSDGLTPLMLYCRKNAVSIEFVRFLIDSGANLKLADNREWTAYDIAKNGNQKSEVLRILNPRKEN
jgi:serine/threonine-protein phosphatase 6 regulatory ankyrin repeat subunit B